MHILIIPSEAYVPPECPISGIFQKDQAMILQDAGLQIGILSSNLKSLRFFTKRAAWLHFGYRFDDPDGFPVYQFDGWNWSVRLPGIIGRRWSRKGMRLFELYVASHGRPDIVHAHNALYAGMLARQLKNEFQIPYVLTEHSSAYAEGFYPTSFHQEVRNIYQDANRLMVVSPKLGTLLESMFEATAEDWLWVPNVVDFRFEDQPVYMKSKEVRNDGFTILSIGNLDKNKNHESLIKAFSDRFRGKSGIRLRIGGEGPLFNRLIRLTRELDVEDQVYLLGYIDRAQVLKEMDSSDLVVLSSRYETFGVVLIEALSRGKPVVATACGGPECIVNRGNGLLVPTRDSTALGNAMEAVMKGISNYDSDRIRTDCLSRFGKNAVKDQLSEVYANVFNRTNSGM